MLSRIEIFESLSSLGKNIDFLASVSSIQPGTFKRDQADPQYAARVLYTKELRDYVYNPAVLNLILLDPELKSIFFRTFGYGGSLNFTMYPAAWLRDLPLLDFGRNVYLGDGILLGTNQVSPDQVSIKVGRIHIGDYSIFDQQCSIGLDSTIGTHCQFGFRSALGLRCSVGNGVRVREMSRIGNCVRVGDGVFVGQDCTIHDFVIIEAGTKIEDGTRIPKFSIVSNNGVRMRKRTDPIPLSV